MSHYFKANDLTQPADLARLNQWVVDTNAEILEAQKLVRTLTRDKITAEPDRLTVNHVSIFQHYADPSELQTLTAATDAIQPLGENLPIASTADLVLTSTPTLLPATREGQILDIHNVGAFTISLQDQAILTDSGLDLYGFQVDLAPGDGGIFIYRQGVWYAISLSVTAPHYGALTVEGTAIFKGNVYQTNASKVTDIQNLLLRGTAVILDKAGFRAAIEAAISQHVHDVTLSGGGTINTSSLVYDGIDPISGDPAFHTESSSTNFT